MKFKASFAGVAGAVLVAAVAAYWWYSPYLELRALQATVKANDVVAFNEHIDYDHIKESLKRQITTALMPVADKQLEGKNKDPNVAAGATIGTGLGMMLIDPMVNAIVTPDVLLKAMQSGSFRGALDRSVQVASAPAAEVNWIIDRKSANTISLHDDDAKPMTLVFTRSGFASWKLSGVELPPDLLKS